MTKRWGLYALIALLVLIFAASQYRLWLADGGVLDNRRLEHRLEQRQKQNAALFKRNRELADYIKRLKVDDREYEALARERFGLVKDDEIFFLFVEGDGDLHQSNNGDAP